MKEMHRIPFIFRLCTFRKAGGRNFGWYVVRSKTHKDFERKDR